VTSHHRLAPKGSLRVVDIRVPMIGRVCFLAFATGLLGFAVFGVVYSIAEVRWAGLGTAAIFSAWGLASWRLGTERLVLEGDDFLVRSYLRTTRVPVSNVDRFDTGSGTYGIDLLLRNSFRTITVNVIQKGNWALWPVERHGTKADGLVTKLDDLVRDRQGRAQAGSKRPARLAVDRSACSPTFHGRGS
jgi:hypothetical protein